MKYKVGQIVKHKYNSAYFIHFGYGFIKSISQYEVCISFCKDKSFNYRTYPKNYLYQFHIVSSIFQDN